MPLSHPMPLSPPKKPMTLSQAGRGGTEGETIVRGWCVQRGEDDLLCRILHPQGLELLIVRVAGANF